MQRALVGSLVTCSPGLLESYRSPTILPSAPGDLRERLAGRCEGAAAIAAPKNMGHLLRCPLLTKTDFIPQATEKGGLLIQEQIGEASPDLLSVRQLPLYEFKRRFPVFAN